jgi:integrase
MRLEEFHRLCEKLTEPYRTMTIVSVCLGLRWSELVGLQWQDIDWRGGELILRRAVVKQIEGDVKTVHSAKPLSLDVRLLDVLKAHKQRSDSTQPSDWVFASPDLNGQSHDECTIQSAMLSETQARKLRSGQSVCY